MSKSARSTLLSALRAEVGRASPAQMVVAVMGIAAVAKTDAIVSSVRYLHVALVQDQFAKLPTGPVRADFSKKP